MGLRELGMLLAVEGQHDSTRASEQLHVAESAISRKISLLEEERTMGANFCLRPGGAPQRGSLPRLLRIQAFVHRAVHEKNSPPGS